MGKRILGTLVSTGPLPYDAEQADIDRKHHVEKVALNREVKNGKAGIFKDKDYRDTPVLLPSGYRVLHKSETGKVVKSDQWYNCTTESFEPVPAYLVGQQIATSRQLIRRIK